jgi:hypothetical protein
MKSENCGGSVITKCVILAYHSCNSNTCDIDYPSTPIVVVVVVRLHLGSPYILANADASSRLGENSIASACPSLITYSDCLSHVPQNPWIDVEVVLRINKGCFSLTLPKFKVQIYAHLMDSLSDARHVYAV